MKLKFIYALFIGCLVLTIAISMASSQGRAASTGNGNTGAPGDQNETCVTCHNNNAALQVSINLEIEDASANPVTAEYIPGETYSFKVKLNNDVGTPAAYGFQLLALKAALDVAGDESSDYTNISDNAKMSVASNTSRSYLEHKGPSATGEFTADWTAPIEGSGPVSIYFCGNGVNSNGMTSGDGAACGKIELTEGMSSNVNTITGVSALKVFPNPTSESVNLSFTANASQDAQLSILSIAGQVMESTAIQLNNGENNLNRNIADYPQGVYFLHLNTSEGVISQKVIKQ